jgi:hypothetical protein
VKCYAGKSAEDRSWLLRENAVEVLLSAAVEISLPGRKMVFWMSRAGFWNKCLAIAF